MCIMATLPAPAHIDSLGASFAQVFFFFNFLFCFWGPSGAVALCALHRKQQQQIATGRQDVEKDSAGGEK